MINGELGIFLSLQQAFKLARFSKGRHFFLGDDFKRFSEPFRRRGVPAQMLGEPCLKIDRRTYVVTAGRSAKHVNPGHNRICQGGRFELPTNPESFRGCSTALNDKWRAWDFSFALTGVQAGALQQGSALLSWRRFQALLRAVSSSRCARADVGRTAPEDRPPNQCSDGRKTREARKPRS